MEELLRLVQKAAVEAGESTYPMKLLFGVVMAILNLFTDREK